LDEFTSTGLIATAVAVQPAYDNQTEGYLYVSTSRTVYDHGREQGCMIFRCPLSTINQDNCDKTVRAIVVEINGSKILSLGLDIYNVSYTDEPEVEGWGKWYWYLLIVLGCLLVVGLAYMALLDCLKLYRRSRAYEEDGSISPSSPITTEHDYYPSAKLPPQQQQHTQSLLSPNATFTFLANSNSVNQQPFTES